MMMLRVLAAPSASAGAIAPNVMVAASAAAVSVFFIAGTAYPKNGRAPHPGHPRQALGALPAAAGLQPNRWVRAERFYARRYLLNQSSVRCQASLAAASS